MSILFSNEYIYHFGTINILNNDLINDMKSVFEGGGGA